MVGDVIPCCWPSDSSTESPSPFTRVSGPPPSCFLPGFCPLRAHSGPADKSPGCSYRPRPAGRTCCGTRPPGRPQMPAASPVQGPRAVAAPLGAKHPWEPMLGTTVHATAQTGARSQPFVPGRGTHPAMAACACGTQRGARAEPRYCQGEGGGSGPEETAAGPLSTPPSASP